MVVQEIITIVSNNVSTKEKTRTKYIIGRPLTDILRSLGTVGSPPPSPVGSVRILCGSHAEYSPSAFCDPSQSSDSVGQLSASQHYGSGVQPKGLLLFYQAGPAQRLHSGPCRALQTYSRQLLSRLSDCLNLTACHLVCVMLT
jgi:hypothetical protein